ncbi:amidohydrolase [Intestinimonas butyriciproducens]|uniref:amidohydrolase n=1 Tax=Intestinimonas butyriciproducens TaxID=1297617 RepID=UPI00195D70C0
MSYLDKAKALEEYMVTMRRHFHQHPEKSMEERETTAFIMARLNEMGIPHRKLNPSGVVAEIPGGRPGKTVALRADMDALTIQEETGLPFASKAEGLMHACGHDLHMAGLLGAARLLWQERQSLGGNVRLIFQPGEEVGKGAKAVIEQGGMEGVDMVFGMHNMPSLPAGTVAGSKGPVFSAADYFKITIQGKAGHGATPEDAIDATVAASALVMNLQPLVSREISSLESLVITVGQLHSGTRFNIISGEAVLEGTVRSFDPAIHDMVPGAMERVVEGIARAYRVEAKLEYDKVAKACVNEEGFTDLCLRSAGKVAQVAPEGRQMIAEDFSEYMQLCPGAFFLYGSGCEYPLHSDHFAGDEQALITACAMYAQVAADALSQI